MTGIDQIIGQQNALEILRRMGDTDRVPHGLLFQGPEGCGKASHGVRGSADVRAGRRPVRRVRIVSVDRNRKPS